MSALFRSLAVLLACAPCLSACGSAETSVSTLPPPVGDSGADVSPDVSGEAAAGDSGPTIRTVLQRAPFGLLDPANKLHDGDFELSGLDSTQYPWDYLEQKMIRTGFECRSGLRCLRLEPGDIVAGVFVWPDSSHAEIAFWAKSKGSQCEQGAIGFLWKVHSTEAPLVLGPLTTTPQDGWCHYGDVVKVDRSFDEYRLALVRGQSATDAVLFDQASVLPRNEPPSYLRVSRPVSENDAPIVSLLRSRARDLRPHRPPREPTPVRNPTGRRTAVRIP